MRISADRAAYLSRVLHRRLLGSQNIVLAVDEETFRLAIAREIAEASRELDSIEEDVRARVEKRKGKTARDFDLLLARDIEDELRRHGA